MIHYLLDTTALIDFSKGREPATSRILKMIETGNEIGICSIPVAEFYAGLIPQKRAEWAEFIAALHYWDITSNAARQAGIWRYDFARKGITLTITDTLIAAVAQEKDAIVVTNNAKDYPMAEITILPLTD